MNIFYKKNILNNKFILLMFIIPIFTPQSFTLLFGGILESVFLIWNGINTIILFFVFVSRKGISKKYSWSIIIFWVIFLFLSIIVGEDLTRTFNTWFGTVSPIINFVLLGSILFSNRIYKENFRIYINILYKYMFTLLTLNFILLILFPNGVVSMEHVFTSGNIAENTKRVNFMATDNTTIQFLITTVLLSELRHYYYGNKNLSRYLVWILSVTTSLIIWSATGVVGIVIFLAAAFIFIFPRNKKWNLSINIAFLWALISFFLIVIFRLMSLFSLIIVYLLGKEISLTNRVYIWDIAYEKIIQHPWVGWGNISKGWIIEHNWYYYYSHNLILDVLLQGGIITVLGLFYILNKSRIALIKQNDKNLETIFACALLALFTMNITESHFTSVYFYVPFILGWLLSINNYEKVNKDKINCNVN